MKKRKAVQIRPYRFMQDVKVHIAAGLVLTTISATVAFAWNSNNRLTSLESAIVSLATDVHDIKTLLLQKQGR